MRALVRIASFCAFIMMPLAGHAESILRFQIDGTIHAGTVTTLEAALAKAKDSTSPLLLIELDTPGGLLDSTREIVKLLLNTDVPVIIYVAPSGARAGSAGTFITMAGHIAAMAPGTNIGAAHPVSITGSDPEKDGGKHMAQKIENDTVAFIESIARQRGRNVEWAKKSVLNSASITDSDALKLGVVDVVARTTEELLAKVDGRTVEVKGTKRVLHTAGSTVVTFEPDAKTKFKNWVANPTIIFILTMIAGLGIYVEFSHPGLIFPAVAAGVSIVLLLMATSVIPISFVGLGLLFLGFVLLLFEIYVTSFGLLAIAGICSLFAGAMLLFDPKEVDLRVPWGLLIGTVTAVAGISIVVAIAVGRTLGLKQQAGAEGFVGKRGEVVDAIEPGKPGRLFANGEYWRATADESIAVNEVVEVVRLTGLEAHVRKVK